MPFGDNPTKDALLLIAFLFIAAGVMAALVLYQTTPVTKGWTNITVSEKYPASSGYRSYTNAKIVTDQGVIYQFENEKLWGRFKVNETYPVSWYKLPGSQDMFINAVTIDGVTSY